MSSAAVPPSDESAQRLGGGAVHAGRAPVRAYPRNITFRDLIRSNKRKSIFLIVLMVLLGVALGAAIAGAAAGWSGAVDPEGLAASAVLGAAAALALAAGASLWSFYGGAGAILAIAGARPIEKKDDPQLFNVVEELSIAAGTPMPRVCLIEDPALNAFATGRDPAHAFVAITTGLRRMLTRDELAGVMAHEISHVRHYDTRFAMLMATMVGLIVFACDAFWRVLRYGRLSRGAHRGKGGGAAVGIVFLVAVVLAMIAPLLAAMIRFAVSRQREYLADAGAVELTRYPQGLIGALEKLGASTIPLKAANRATAHLYIVNPLKGAMRGQGHELSSVFLTHPPLHLRIERLRALTE
jgi:heat shock protein HtpX